MMPTTPRMATATTEPMAKYGLRPGWAGMSSETRDIVAGTGGAGVTMLEPAAASDTGSSSVRRSSWRQRQQ